jgi:hypothetical protein
LKVTKKSLRLNGLTTQALEFHGPIYSGGMIFFVFLSRKERSETEVECKTEIRKVRDREQLSLSLSLSRKGRGMSFFFLIAIQAHLAQKLYSAVLVNAIPFSVQRTPENSRKRLPNLNLEPQTQSRPLFRILKRGLYLKISINDFMP